MESKQERLILKLAALAAVSGEAALLLSGKDDRARRCELCKDYAAAFVSLQPVMQSTSQHLVLAARR